MKKYILIPVLFLITLAGYSQKNILEKTVDSIIQEANLLYNYEKVIWNASDLLMMKEGMREKFGGYVVYHKNDTVYASFVDKPIKNRIAQYIFVAPNLDNPIATSFAQKQLSKIEIELLDIKIKIIEQLSDPKYDIRIMEGFNPNLVLLKEPTHYKLYIIMGTPQDNLIPFGNDYLFTTDLEGTIKDWRKFHSSMIPAQTKMDDGGIVTSAIHSHLKMTPYITATDICTFRLYGGIYGLKEFMVLSTALNVYFKYNIDTNSIEITKQ